MSSSTGVLLPETIKYIREKNTLEGVTDEQLADAAAMLSSEFYSVIISPQFQIAVAMNDIRVIMTVMVNMFAREYLGQLIGSGAINPEVLTDMVKSVADGHAQGKDEKELAKQLWG